MIRFLIILSVFAISVIAERDYCKSFKKFQELQLDTPEDQSRSYLDFQSICSEISDHQDMYAANLVSYNLTANKFVGFDADNLKGMLCRTVPPPTMRAMPAPKKSIYPPVPAAYMNTKNWCYLHNPPRDQLTCGACWAFSSIAVIEACVNRNWGQQIMLSEQMLIDCSSDNLGCDGGWPTLALDFSNSMGVSGNKYLYQNAQGRCAVRKFKPLISPDTFIRINEEYLNGDEDALKRIVFKYGCVSVVISIPNEMFVYGGGVFMCDTCDRVNLNHAVVICGYGTDPKYGDYWMVRNSWGANWGEKGYIKIARGRNTCGIAQYVMWVEM